MDVAFTIYDPTKNVPDKPDYWQTVRYVFQYINFPISEDEVYVITNLFIEKWDDSTGKKIVKEEIKEWVMQEARSRVFLMMPTEKIAAVIDLIFSYLQSIGQYV